MLGKRLPIVDGKLNPPTNPGEYCGPVYGYTGPQNHPAIFFLLPIARDEGVPHEAKFIHHVECPPHVFTEEPDGSLTIRESIGAGPRPNYYWHGYLTEGRWELEKSKP